ncbi:D-cysteine desulfhydrase 2, mitochondrial-like isoform X2 [Zingiber officinale]|uniref:D-cysteine desulfhydrase 2, mitochondrial-like isoform X2 n=1 Tax=Zingiber officinale TaxID=94328 RepID=UPI001C4CCC92|nr:D-cysteine desulfhydrase 2, mitochondrial-like isoform X2 [Zingiber officinale]
MNITGECPQESVVLDQKMHLTQPLLKFASSLFPAVSCCFISAESHNHVHHFLNQTIIVIIHCAKCLCILDSMQNKAPEGRRCTGEGQEGREGKEEMSLRRVTITVAAPLPPPLQTPPQLPRLRVAPCRRCYSNSKPSPLLRRQWMLSSPSSPIHAISFTKPSTSSFTYYSNGLSVSHLRSAEEAKPSSSFYLIRDDLLHPLVNGNKARKLDAIIPLILRHAATDLITCGGVQSAHTAALAVCCAERGMRAHLLLRGEQPAVPTGYNLVSLMYGSVSYVPRSVYANRNEMLMKHAELVAGDQVNVVWADDILNLENDELSLNDNGTPLWKVGNVRRVVIVNEGAGSVAALLGLIRLVEYLSQTHIFGTDQKIALVVDAGTGTTAVGLALGIAYLGLPWKVVAVMLADTKEKYEECEKCLVSNFKRVYGLESLEDDEGIVQWVERLHPRRFGKVLDGEIDLCRQIAQQTGVPLDPIYTLAAWEQAVLFADSEDEKDSLVVMLHTGGTLGLFGLAQRL